MKKKEGFKGQRTIVLPDFIIREVQNRPISQALYLTDIGFYPHAIDHYRTRPKGCMQNILMYCTEGQGWITIGGKRIKVLPNQYFIIPKKEAHAYGSDKNDPWSIYWLHFSGSQAAFFTNPANKAETIVPSKVARIGDRLQLFEEMFQNLEMGYSFENIDYANICLWHFLASFRYLSQFRQIRKIKEPDMVECSIRFMKDNFGQKISLEQLAHQAGISVSHYSMAFKNKTGRSPLDYFIHLKIQHACQLLDHSALRVKEVAAHIGYDDPYYFSRIFSKVMGISPKSYRVNLKG